MFFLKLMFFLYTFLFKTRLSFNKLSFLDLCLRCFFLFPQALGDGFAPLLDLLKLEALLASLAHSRD